MTKPQKFLTSFSEAMWDTKLTSFRITLALGEMWWGVLLLWPGDTFDRPTYRHMATVMNEEAWGLLFLVSAATQLSIVLLEDMHSLFARYFACWNACIWGYTVWSMMVSVYPPPAAIGGEIAIAMGACWVFVQPYLLALLLRKGNNCVYRRG